MIVSFDSNLIFYQPKYSILHFYSTYKKESYLLFKDDHRLCFKPDHFPTNHLNCQLVQKVQFCIVTVPIKIIIFVFKNDRQICSKSDILSSKNSILHFYSIHKNNFICFFPDDYQLFSNLIIFLPIILIVYLFKSPILHFYSTHKNNCIRF